jgi:hypothetical protein
MDGRSASDQRRSKTRDHGGWKKSEEEEVLFIGTQFSNLSTAVDTSAAAACNAWCVCVCVCFFSLFKYEITNLILFREQVYSTVTKP